MHLIWSHGKDSGPWGSKSKVLAETAKARGFDMQALDYQRTKDPDERVRMLRGHLDSLEGPVALAGSSMGGYVSVAAAQELDMAGDPRVSALFVMAPALYLPGYHWIDFPHLQVPDVEIVAGWRDEIVPVENIERFARIHRAKLHVFDAEHRLGEAMDAIALLFGAFLDRLPL